MSLLIFGLDGLDYEYVHERGLLGSLGPQLLEQDLDGANALYTYRVWPSIFAGEDQGAGAGAYEAFQPSNPYIWEEVPAAVFLAPLAADEHGKTRFSNEYQDEFPEFWRESTRPPGRLEEGYDKLRAGVGRQLQQEAPVIIAVTRIPDIVLHRWGDGPKAHEWVERACDLAEDLCGQADDYLVFSDHGFAADTGADGLEAHTRRATVASSFTDPDTMSGLISRFKPAVHSKLNESQMEALGYV